MVEKKYIQHTVKIPEEYPKEYRLAIGQAIVEYIRERTQSGRGVGGKSFPAYSKSYMKSLDFRVSGKTKKVNLTLSGDMLAQLDVIKQKRGEIVVGYDPSDEVAPRVEGNVRGTYGNPTPLKGKARPFLGLTEKEKEKILKDFPIDEISKLNEEILRFAREKQEKKLNSLVADDDELKTFVKFAKELYDTDD